MPGATTARFVVCALEMPMKLFMMPHTSLSTMSALRNMPHGDRSRGSTALAITDAPEIGAAGVSTAGAGVAGWETAGELSGAPGADGWATAAVPMAAAVTIASAIVA